MPTLKQELEAKRTELIKKIKRERLQKWIDSAIDFEYRERLEQGNVPKLVLTIEITRENFHLGVLPKTEYYSGEVYQ